MYHLQCEYIVINYELKNFLVYVKIQVFAFVYKRELFQSILQNKNSQQIYIESFFYSILFYEKFFCFSIAVIFNLIRLMYLNINAK
jgi:hypothetical protein